MRLASQAAGGAGARHSPLLPGIQVNVTPSEVEGENTILGWRAVIENATLDLICIKGFLLVVL